MSAAETPLQEGHSVTVWVFNNVSNAAAVQAHLQQQTPAPNMAVVDAAMLPDAFVLAAAAHRALAAQLADEQDPQEKPRLKSKGVHLELVNNLHPGSNVGSALKHFGIKATTTTAAVAIIDATPEQVTEVGKLVQGELVDASTIPSFTNKQAVMKLFKIKELELQTSSLSDSVLSRMAVKGL